jgi:transcriptional regulator with XRE-family HTH domain
MGVELGQKLKALRRAQRATLQELARDLGVHFTTVSAWERGRSQPDLQVLRRLATRLGGSLADLVGVGEPARPHLRLTSWGQTRWEEFVNRTEALQLAAALLRRSDPLSSTEVHNVQEALAGERPSVTELLRLGSRYDVQAVEAPAGPVRHDRLAPGTLMERLNGMPEELRAAAADLLLGWLDLIDAPARDAGTAGPGAQPEMSSRRRRGSRDRR